ncbi:nuclear transport factor 2 family protein [Sphingobacterium suaedae]|uniref:Nuclear transport factor 2 family protein n=1 Tax=Sphingobacterium suaedae TaxID=1686402 RepID=A0ABW5KK18_9SPHI
MSTLLGEYLNSLKIVKDKIRELANVKRPRMNDLNNKETAKPTPEEFYKIIYLAIISAGLPDSEFGNAIETIFPTRPKGSLLIDFKHLPKEIQFLKKYTLRQNEVEEKIGMSENKISRLANEKTKDLLAVELICFIEGLGENVLDTFKRIYGPIETVDSSLPSASILNDRTNKVVQYIAAYNDMKVDNMVENLADHVLFENISNNEVTLSIQGKDAFREQAIEALSYFSEREQAIGSITHTYNSTKIVINYKAIAAMDFPNGLKKGDEISLKGKSIFEFSEDGKIVRLTDIS